MTKKKNIASKLVLVLFVLTLISCCLLGSTFARYVSGGTGSASVGIAKWEIDITGGGTSGSTTVTFGDLSPSMAEFSNSSTRSNETGMVQVATIKNSGEVAATVTVAAGTIAVNLGDIGGEQYSFATGDKVYTTSNVESVQFNTSYGASENQVKGLFSIELFFYGTEAGSIDKVPSVYLKPEESVSVWAELTWTSADGSAAGIAAYADAIDTWVGEHVESVSYDITYTAVQASQQPVT